jgi:hypothetical protein
MPSKNLSESEFSREVEATLQEGKGEASGLHITINNLRDDLTARGIVCNGQDLVCALNPMITAKKVRLTRLNFVNSAIDVELCYPADS